MNIRIDTTPLGNGNSNRGVGRYTRELLDALNRLNSGHLFFTNEAARGARIDLVHYPYFDLFFATLPIFKPEMSVVTIHDVIPLVFPSHYPVGIKGNMRLLSQRVALRSVDHVITVSQCSKRDIEHHLKVAGDRITVIPEASSKDIDKVPQAMIDVVRKKYSLPKNYFLYVGDLNYNKNLPFLLRVLARIPKVNLVLVGSQLNNTAIPEGKALHSLVSSPELASRVFILSTLGSDASNELSALYSGSVAYIQPSLYEGFGLPVIEAMQCGTIVLSSRGGSLPEVVGNAALLFHPMDEQSLETVIRKVLRLSDAERKVWIKKGLHHAQSFSWERTAQETLEVYDHVLSHKK